MKISTLVNAWKHLLFDVESPVDDFGGFEVQDFARMLASGGEEIPREEVASWLEVDKGDPGYHMLSEQEIVDSVLHGEEKDEDETRRCFL